MNAISELISHIQIGKAARCGPLEVFALIQTIDASKITLDAPTPYVLLADALESRTAHVEEVSAEGDVPNLKLVNEGDVAVLALDGEELVGAKQNRILSVSILAPARSTTVIPVACVERGRWRHVSRTFAPSQDMLFASARANKARAVRNSYARKAGPNADQGQVWADIDRKLGALRVNTSTEAMGEAYRDRATRIDDYVAHVMPEPGQVGVVFALNGQICGLDIVERHDVCAKLLPKLVRSYALDAIEVEETRPNDRGIAPGVCETDIAAFLSSVAAAHATISPAVGLGEDVRFVDNALEGGALIHKGTALHVSAFAAAAFA